MIREIFIKKNWPIPPIQWVYGTNGLQIGFDILDFDLSTVSSVKFYSMTASGARYEATGTKNGSTVSFKPVSGFFAVGCNTLQCELVATSGTVYSFAVSVFCESNNKFEGAEQDPIALANYIEQINKNTRDITALNTDLTSLTGRVQTLEEGGPHGGSITTEAKMAIWEFANSVAFVPTSDPVSILNNLKNALGISDGETDTPEEPDDPPVDPTPDEPEEPTGEPITESREGTVLTISGLANVNLTHSGTTAEIGA